MSISRFIRSSACAPPGVRLYCRNLANATTSKTASKVFDVLQPRDRDPMLNFDDRDLVESAEVAGFGRVYLTLEIETEPPEPLRWEARPRSASGMRRTCGRSSRPGAAAAGWPPPTSAQSRDARGIPHSRKRREANGAACFNRRTLCVGSR